MSSIDSLRERDKEIKDQGDRVCLPYLPAFHCHQRSGGRLKAQKRGREACLGQEPPEMPENLDCEDRGCSALEGGRFLLLLAGVH